MITVTFLPAGERGPFEDGATEGTFETHEAFKEWVLGYVCSYCRKDFRDFYGHAPSNLDELMAMGCGCEVYVEDPDNIIDWDDKI